MLAIFLPVGKRETVLIGAIGARNANDEYWVLALLEFLIRNHDNSWP